MSQTKSLLLGVHWLLKTWPKPGQTHAWKHEYSSFCLNHEKLCLRTANSKIMWTYQYLHCFWAHTVSWESLWKPFWCPLGGQKPLGGQSKTPVSTVLVTLSKNMHFWKMSLAKSLFLMLQELPNRFQNVARSLKKWFEIDFWSSARAAARFGPYRA